ncbi:Transcriptional regulator MtlR [Anoxybacillus sp. BCO1]|nr:Transcriptional regulator MtlR [Anoxybacillus sp. BCO1]
MYISARERKILDLLLANPKGITVGDVAKQLDVSERTVHRDLKGVEQVVESYDLQLIKKAGVGIQIVGEEEKSDSYKCMYFVYHIRNIHLKSGKR